MTLKFSATPAARDGTWPPSTVGAGVEVVSSDTRHHRLWALRSPCPRRTPGPYTFSAPGIARRGRHPISGRLRAGHAADGGAGSHSPAVRAGGPAFDAVAVAPEFPAARCASRLERLGD